MDEYEDDPDDTTMHADPLWLVIALLLGVASWRVTYVVLAWVWHLLTTLASQ